jgi:hypothetical protein
MNNLAETRVGELPNDLYVLSAEVFWLTLKLKRKITGTPETFTKTRSSLSRLGFMTKKTCTQVNIINQMNGNRESLDT